MGHKTLVGGTAYEVSGGRTLVNGTGYDIGNGRTLVGGTGYDVSFIKTYTITLTNTGHSTYCYVTVNGTKYINSGSVIEVEEGTVVTFTCYSATNTSTIYRVRASGSTTQVKSGMDKINYNYTVNQDISVSFTIGGGRGSQIYIYETE